MRCVLFVCSLLLGACAATTSFTRSSTKAYPVKPANCPLEMLTIPPQRQFVELGTFDIDNKAQPGTPGNIETISDLLELVQGRACAEGADAILGRKVGVLYMQAVALRWVESPPPAATPETPPAAAK